MVNFSLELLFHLTVFIFFGAVLGSFSSAIIHRIQRGDSWILGQDKKAARSQCPQCHHVLGFKDLLPVISWVWQKSICRYCHQKISKQYLFLELGVISFALAVYFLFGFSQISFFFLCLSPFVLAQAILFFRRNIISRQLCAIIGGIILFYLLIGFLN